MGKINVFNERNYIKRYVLPFISADELKKLIELADLSEREKTILLLRRGKKSLTQIGKEIGLCQRTGCREYSRVAQKLLEKEETRDYLTKWIGKNGNLPRYVQYCLFPILSESEKRKIITPFFFSILFLGQFQSRLNRYKKILEMMEKPTEEIARIIGTSQKMVGGIRRSLLNLLQAETKELNRKRIKEKIIRMKMKGRKRIEKKITELYLRKIHPQFDCQSCQKFIEAAFIKQETERKLRKFGADRGMTRRILEKGYKLFLESPIIKKRLDKEFGLIWRTKFTETLDNAEVKEIVKMLLKKGWFLIRKLLKKGFLEKEEVKKEEERIKEILDEIKIAKGLLEKRDENFKLPEDPEFNELRQKEFFGKTNFEIAQNPQELKKFNRRLNEKKIDYLLVTWRDEYNHLTVELASTLTILSRLQEKLEKIHQEIKERKRKGKKGVEVRRILREFLSSLEF